MLRRASDMNRDVERKLQTIHARLRACRKCATVCDSPVHGPAIESRVMLIGQAPGVHEATLGRPFAHTAGKTLFKWFHQATGIREEVLRELVYFSAVARCFPGKAKSGSGDRAPSPLEIANCREHLAAEVATIKPDIVIAVGKSAITEILAPVGILPKTPLVEVVGKKWHVTFHGVPVVVIPLPHPSGVSRWPRAEPGKTKLAEALNLVAKEFSRLDL